MPGLLNSPLLTPAGGGGPTGYAAAVMAQSTLLAYYRLGETSGTTMADSSGLGHNGSYFDTKSPTTGLLTGDTDGATAQPGFTTPGVSWMDDTAFLTAGITVECILKSNGSQSNRGVVTRFDANHCFLMWMNVSGQLAWRAYNSSDTPVDVAWGTAPTTGVKFHAVGTYNPAGMARLYINGTQVDSSSAVSGNLKHGATQSIEIGSYQNDIFLFDGVIDEVAIYQGEQSSADIAARAALI